MSRDPGAYWDAELEKKPPVIEWEVKAGGVRVPVSVLDPHSDGIPNGAKTHCKNNHEFTPANTIVKPDGRQCRTCKNEKRRPLTSEQKRRAAALKRMRRAERQPDIQVEYVECTDPELLAAGTRDI